MSTHRNERESRDGNASVGVLSKTVLVVDDDAAIRKSLTIRLEHRGYDVITAPDGLTATKLAMKQDPDLILLDLGLPAGDGHEILDRLSSHPQTQSIPVIVVSGNRYPAARARAFEKGARAFVEKPFYADELMGMVEDVFH